MKIIFLDFDGVLNSHEWLLKNRLKMSADTFFQRNSVDELAVARVEKLVKATGAKVVVSSTWRIFTPLPLLQNILKNHGFTGEVISVTPRLGTARGNEIASWLESHGPVENFVILDDDSDMVHLKHRLVQTNMQLGLQDEHVEKAISLLSEEHS